MTAGGCGGRLLQVGDSSIFGNCFHYILFCEANDLLSTTEFYFDFECFVYLSFQSAFFCSFLCYAFLPGNSSGQVRHQLLRSLLLVSHSGWIDAQPFWVVAP